jgi:hypothetical protein
MPTGLYDIRNHVDYEEHMKDYIKKSECQKLIQQQSACDIRKHPQYKALVLRLKEKLQESEMEAREDIRNHPQYEQLVKQIEQKVQAKTQSEAEERVATELTALREKNSQLVQIVKKLSNRVSAFDETCEEEVATARKQILEKYARKDTTTCPPTYLPARNCDDITNHPRFKAQQEKIRSLEDQLKGAQETSPRPAINSELVETIKRLKAQIRELSSKVPRQESYDDIKEHPKYAEIVRELTAQCATKVRKELSKCEKELKERMRMRIEDHPDYPFMKNRFENLIQQAGQKACSEEQSKRYCPPPKPCPDPMQSRAYTLLAEKYRNCMSNLTQEEKQPRSTCTSPLASLWSGEQRFLSWSKQEERSGSRPEPGCAKERTFHLTDIPMLNSSTSMWPHHPY